MGKGKPTLPDINTLIQAGINPKNGLPVKMGDTPDQLQTNLAIIYSTLDEQEAVNRYVWYNLPDGLDGELLERILYYRGQGAFFYMDTIDQFFFLPYALDGTIDCYGRFLGITPLPFNGQSAADEKGKIKPWITGLIRKPVYKIPLQEEVTLEMYKDSCVLLHDYAKQQSEIITPRSSLQQSLLNMMSEVLPFARTALLSNSGIKGMRVNDEDQQANVLQASNSITNAALTGKPWVPVVGNLEFQDLTSAGSATKSEEYLLFLQALDNFRLSTYGIKNGGLFQKKAHMLDTEAEMNDGNTELVLQDGLRLRQNFCDTVNAIWDLGIYCEQSESLIGDQNGDGLVQDEQDQSGDMPGSQPEMGGEQNV